MRIYQDIHELVGNTPMLRLNHFPVKEGINLFAKLELWNPAGSVKDRLGEYFIKDAEERGELKKAVSDYAMKGFKVHYNEHGRSN